MKKTERKKICHLFLHRVDATKVAEVMTKVVMFQLCINYRIIDVEKTESIYFHFPSFKESVDSD